MILLSRRPFSLSRNRDASVALECETEMNVEEPLVKAVPESGRRSPTQQSSPFTAAPESAGSRAPAPPEGTPLKQTATRPGPPVDLPEVRDMEVDEQWDWSMHSCSRSLMLFVLGHQGKESSSKRMITYLAGEWQNVFFEEEKLETYIKSDRY